MKFIRLTIYVLFIFSQCFNLPAQELLPKENQKTVLITGGAGFIGSNFLKYMYDKYPSYHFIVLDALTYAGSLDKIPQNILDSDRFEFIHNTILNQEIVDQAIKRSQFIVHFAAETHVTRSIQDDSAFFYTDVIGTRTLMASVVKHAKNVERFIHISTSEVYGTSETEPMDENHPLNPRSPYAAAKLGADRLVYSYCCTFNVPATIIRPFNNYGPQQHTEKLIPRFITSALKGEPLTVHGTGDQKRDWIHTLDTARGIDAALHIENYDSIKHQVINLGSGISTSVLEIATKILEHLNLSPSLLQFVTDRPGQVDNHISSTRKAKELLNWTALIPFEEGLKNTIDWYKNNPEIWQKMDKDSLVTITINEKEVVNQ